MGAERKRLTLKEMPFSRLIIENKHLAELRREYSGMPAEERWQAASFEYDAALANSLFGGASSGLPIEMPSMMPRDDGLCPGAVLALAIDPHHAPALLTVGSVEYQLGRIQEAMKLFLELPALQAETPDLPQIIDKAGDFLLDQEDYENARALYAAAAQRHPSVALYHGALSYCETKLGRMVEAVDHARRAVALEPDNHIHLNDLGWCLVNAESYGEAEEVLKKAVALSPPGYPLARNNLKDLHRRRRRTRRTKER